MLLFERCDSKQEIKNTKNNIELHTEYLGNIFRFHENIAGVLYPQTPKYDVYGNHIDPYGAKINPYEQYQQIDDFNQHSGILNLRKFI